MYRPLSLFQSLSSFRYLPRRTCTELPKGIQYPGFTYYPRDENFKDPPYEPSKLFLIKRIKSMKGTSATEKKNLGLLNIDGKVKDKGHVAVVKNIPEVNAVLWTVQHLIEIKPLLIKGELPKDGDYSGTFLRQTGEFIISPKLKVSTQQIEASEKFVKNSNRLDRSYLKEYLRKKWEKNFDSYE